MTWLTIRHCLAFEGFHRQLRQPKLIDLQLLETHLVAHRIFEPLTLRKDLVPTLRAQIIDLHLLLPVAHCEDHANTPITFAMNLTRLRMLDYRL